MREATTEPHTFLAGGGEMGALMRSHDWAATSLGPPDNWPDALTAMVSVNLNSALLGTVLWGQELRLLYNDAYAPALGERHPWALGRPIAEVWGSVWDQLAPTFLGVLLTGVPRFETRYPLTMERKGKSVLTYWNFSVAPIRDGDGRVLGLLNQAIEISDQVQAEERLLGLNRSLEQQVGERTAELSHLWNTSPDLMLVIDFDGVFRRVNPAWTTMLGYTPDELVGHHVNEFVVSDDHAQTVGAYVEAAEGGLPRLVNRYRHRDGSLRWISWVAAPSGNMTYATGRDITLDRERARVLRQYQDIVEATEAPICAFDTDYRLIAFNKAHNDEFRRVNGFDTKIGDVFPDLLVPEQRPVMRALMTRALTGEAFMITEEFGNPEIGTPCWELTYSPLRDEQGRVVGAFHHAKDISDRLRAEADLAGTQEALRQSQKMEAVGQLTGGLAHDFNNLLAGISGSLDMMQTRITQGRITEIDRYMIGAQGAAKRAAALTHRLLAFSRRQTLEPKPTDVNRLITGMEDLIQRTVGPQITVEFVGKGGLWPTLVDPNQLENALLNLSINARDAMPDGGKITIETGNRWLDDRSARERDLPPGQYVSMCVSDTGSGMTKDVIERAFDPFFTTKPIGLGTGLGLSMIYGFARQSGGQARIYSEVGQGAMVCLYLPRHDVEEAAEALPDMAVVQGAAQSKTVLVVDDEPLVRMLVVDAVEDLGYTPLEAGDGPQALKILRSNIDIDLLISDVGLPNGMNGRQVADAARELRPGLKVMFVTGYAENAVLSHGHLDPGMQVVTKPFDMTVLSNRIQGMLTD